MDRPRVKLTREDILDALGKKELDPKDLAKEVGHLHIIEDSSQEFRELIWALLADHELELTWDRRLKRR